MNAAGAAQNLIECSWNSDVDGTGATTVANATKVCLVDLAAGEFYHFFVLVDGTVGALVQFLGVEFPP